MDIDDLIAREQLRAGALGPGNRSGKRQVSRVNAHLAKRMGAGATATAPRARAGIGAIPPPSRGLGSILKGAAVGFLTGGVTGAVTGAVAGATNKPRKETGGVGQPAPRGFLPTPRATTTGCPPGRIRIGSACIDPLAAPPGGRPLATTPTGTPTTGTAVNLFRGATMTALGPAVQPQAMAQTRLRCPRGMVLGLDDLCYPKAMLGRRSKFRKWRQPPRPPVSASDAAAIRRAERARERVKNLAKNVGFTVKKR